MSGVESVRVMTKVARLYHVRGVRQSEIADRLGISQARVSRLLRAAEERRIVQTVVRIPDGLHADLEETVAARYGLARVRAIEARDLDDEAGLTVDLGTAAATVVAEMPLDGATIGFTPWSRSLRAVSEAGAEFRPASEASVVEMLGDVGPPSLQHDATRATQRLADRIGATPLFVRTPGVMPSAAIRAAMTDNDTHTRLALDRLDRLDVVITGVGLCEVESPLTAGDNFFTDEQFASAKRAGAVAQLNLRFLDGDGSPVAPLLGDLVVGVTLEQLRAAPHRIGVAGGPRKYQAIRAVVRGGWIDTLVTDVGTATRLLSEEGPRRGRA